MVILKEGLSAFEYVRFWQHPTAFIVCSKLKPILAFHNSSWSEKHLFSYQIPNDPLSNADSYMASVKIVQVFLRRLADLGRYSAILCFWWCLQPVWCAIFAFGMRDCTILINSKQISQRSHSWCIYSLLQAFWHCRIVISLHRKVCVQFKCRSTIFKTQIFNLEFLE